MRKIIILFSFLIYFSISGVIREKDVTFREIDSEIDNIQVNTANTYIVKATFDTKKYLYIYPEFDTSNKGVFKIFFKKYSQNDEVANILDSEFYTLEVNSGLLINANGLNYKEANIFIVGFGSINVYIMFLIVDGITFPQTTLINQFLLPKKTKIQFDYYINDKNENAISIVSKYSLRNINIKITNQDKSDITSEKGGYVYPNGFSFLFDMSKYQTGTYGIEIENKNINSRDEIIILGYTKFNGEQTFPNSIVNGINAFLLYLSNLWKKCRVCIYRLFWEYKGNK